MKPQLPMTMQMLQNPPSRGLTTKNSVEPLFTFHWHSMYFVLTFPNVTSASIVNLQHIFNENLYFLSILTDVKIRGRRAVEAAEVEAASVGVEVVLQVNQVNIQFYGCKF